MVASFDALLRLEVIYALNTQLKVLSLAIVCPRRPKEHLMSVLVQNTQAIGILRQVQSVEQRLGFHLYALQIGCDVRNPIEYGVRVVLFSNTEELNGEHHLAASLYGPNLAYARIGNANGF
jgi:hypothetical protein